MAGEGFAIDQGWVVRWDTMQDGLRDRIIDRAFYNHASRRALSFERRGAIPIGIGQAFDDIELPFERWLGIPIASPIGVGRKKRAYPKKKRLTDVVAKSVELLPGIPDDITLLHIATKLPWGAFHVLSCVSRGWDRAIRRNQVYDARVVCRDTHSDKDAKGIDRIFPYSPREERFYDPPRVPHFGGIRRSCECISLGGQLYVLGGLMNQETHLSSGEVYAFDLVCKRKWRRCASMKFPRQKFGCGLLEGKIYVFGGISQWKPVSESEVYDPTEDTWSLLPPMPRMPTLRTRYNHRVVTVGEELVIHGGQVFNPGYEAWLGDRVHIDQHGFNQARRHVGEWCEDEKSVDAYHPGKQQWRVVTSKTFWWPHMEIVPSTGGKFLSIDLGNAYMHDLDDRDYVVHLHSFISVDTLRRSSSSKPVRIVRLNGGELLATVRLSPPGAQDGRVVVGQSAARKLCLVRSIGFGNKKFIAWEKVPPNEQKQPFEGIQIVCPISL